MTRMNWSKANVPSYDPGRVINVSAVSHVEPDAKPADLDRVIRKASAETSHDGFLAAWRAGFGKQRAVQAAREQIDREKLTSNVLSFAERMLALKAKFSRD